MFYNVQTDPHWKDDIMAMEGDTLGKYGCLVTALGNIFETNPDVLNEELKVNFGYALLAKKYTKGQESFLVWDVAEEILEMNHEVYDGAIIIDDDTAYIARILHRRYGTGHYCNLLSAENGKYRIFDTYYGDILECDKKDIHGIIKITIS